jgi:hypothetical protein
MAWIQHSCFLAIVTFIGLSKVRDDGLSKDGWVRASLRRAQESQFISRLMVFCWPISASFGMGLP